MRDSWFFEGQKRYRDAHRLLILADAVGSNSYRLRVWKAQLQELSDIAVLPITACHYPPGCSKWNPILKRGGNELDERVSNDEMRALRIEPHAVCPAWNYTISPPPRQPHQIDQLIYC